MITVGAVSWDYLVYVITTPTVKVSWDPIPEASSYDWRLIWIDPTNEFLQLSGTVSEALVEIPRPRSGHFRVEARACNSEGCSNWAASTTDGSPKNWILFWKQPAPVIGVGDGS